MTRRVGNADRAQHRVVQVSACAVTQFASEHPQRRSNVRWSRFTAGDVRQREHRNEVRQRVERDRHGAPSVEMMIPARLAPAASARDEPICIFALPSEICSRGMTTGKNATKAVLKTTEASPTMQLTTKH
jgi:hypothetical protein